MEFLKFEEIFIKSKPGCVAAYEYSIYPFSKMISYIRDGHKNKFTKHFIFTFNSNGLKRDTKSTEEIYTVLME